MQPLRAAGGGDFAQDDTLALPHAKKAEHEANDISILAIKSACIAVRWTASVCKLIAKELPLQQDMLGIAIGWGFERRLAGNERT